MGFSFSTEDCRPQDRRAIWYDVINKACCSYIVDFGDLETFWATLEARRVGDLELVKVGHNTAGSYRSSLEVNRSDPGLYYVVFQLVGTSRMEQCKSEAVLQPGDFTLIDSGRPCRFLFDGNSINLNLHIPRVLLDARQDRSVPPLATRMGGSAGLLAGELLRLAFDRASTLSPAEATSVRDAILALAFAPGVSGVRQGLSAASVTTVRNFISSHLADSALSPTMIAEAHGISLRKLQRLFSAEGETVADIIRRARLGRCARDLADMELRGTSVTEICYRWGFSDSAHFSRAFKAEYGYSPKEYRCRHEHVAA